MSVRVTHFPYAMLTDKKPDKIRDKNPEQKSDSVAYKWYVWQAVCVECSSHVGMQVQNACEYPGSNAKIIGIEIKRPVEVILSDDH